VDPWWHGQRARRCAHRSLASGRSGAPKLAGGGAKWRGEREELDSGLTGARAALRRPGDGDAKWGSSGEGARLLLGFGGALWRGGRAVNTGVNGFNAIEDGPT
jgi:hypothetical protein